MLWRTVRSKGAAILGRSPGLHVEGVELRWSTMHPDQNDRLLRPSRRMSQRHLLGSQQPRQIKTECPQRADLQHSATRKTVTELILSCELADYVKHGRFLAGACEARAGCRVFEELNRRRLEIFTLSNLLAKANPDSVCRSHCFKASQSRQRFSQLIHNDGPPKKMVAPVAPWQRRRNSF